MKRTLKHIIVFFIVFISVVDLAAQIKGHAGGYLISKRDKVDQAFDAGYSMYVNAYPLLKDYPGREFQSGLFGTWMHPHYDKPKPVERLYTDIEGGLGWWRDTEYATATPKFIMGGVQLNFMGWANGPGAGQGRDWSNPKGKYGVAQLSPWVLWPPDGLNLKQGTCGELWGSGYLPLPLTEPKATTAGKPVSTGNQCWTLFLNTATFKGPVAFFTPYFWTEVTAEKPELEGFFLDQCPSQANKPFQMETQHIHSYEAADEHGQRYARIAPTQYPIDDEGNTSLLHRLMVYKKQALWDEVEAWFKGGQVASGRMKTEHAAMQTFQKGVRSSWRFYGDHIPKEERALMNITDFMDESVTDKATLRVRWEGDLLKKRKLGNGEVITLPEYYKLVSDDPENKIGKWIALAPEEVPKETGLHHVNFKNQVPRTPVAYITPKDAESSWKKPGPAAGPFKKKLGDGSIITYYWYRFADQPALLNADMTPAEREEMQRRAELLHTHWTKDREYLPPPMFGELAEIDPALIVTPPKGMEIGYVPIVTKQEDASSINQWSFEQSDESFTGHHRFVEGVKGKAIVMDGYTSSIIASSDQAPQLGDSFTIEAWVAIGAYPWNWTPIAAQENTISLNSNLDEITWPDDIADPESLEGYFFGIGPQGQLGMHFGTGTWEVCQTSQKIPLREWTHIAATLNHNNTVILYINGKESTRMELDGSFIQAKHEEFRIGRPRQQIEASNPVRAFATLPSWYSFDGILDELEIHKKALTPNILAKRHESRNPGIPELPNRVMPSGPAGPGKFGASYAHLKYFPEWDAQWRLEADPDIVVQFDDSPVRVVFWRGTRYGPAWVMENGMWMGDQSIENFNGVDGCIEHMLDPRCRFSHVRIIENTPARVVVHWRYLPTSANGNHSQVDRVSGWEDWVDEYYTFYPDQLGVRKVVLHTDGISLWPEEVIAFCQPGQRPEDVVELGAMTLANLNGKQHTYTWADKSPIFRHKGRWELGGYIHFGDELGEKPNIMMVNMKSEYKPYQIFELECNFTCFAHEHRKEVSHFPWWNHWPAAMIPSDGRYCQAADRPSHFSLAWGTPVPHKGENNTYVWTWMYGATKDEISTLTPLARSWTRPPQLTIQSGATDSEFDSTQRCYVISDSKNSGIDKLKFSLEASEDSPVCNPALVIKNWGDHPVELKINGKKGKQGESFRVGHIRTVNQYDLVIWLEMESNSQVEFSVERKK